MILNTKSTAPKKRVVCRIFQLFRMNKKSFKFILTSFYFLIIDFQKYGHFNIKFNLKKKLRYDFFHWGCRSNQISENNIMTCSVPFYFLLIKIKL